MPRRMFRLLLTLQRIDEKLRIERQRKQPRPIAILELASLRRRAKALIARLTSRPAHAA